MFAIILFTILFLINVATFWMYADDKHRAYYGMWRWPEAALLALTALGGAYGASCGMLLMRHKTQHTVFLITVPLCLVVWLVALCLFCYFV